MNIFKILLLLLLFSCVLSAKEEEKLVIGYLPTWKNWDTKDIDGDKFSAIKLSFLKIKHSKAVFGSGTAINPFEKQVEKLIELKKEYPNLQIIFSVGGGNVNGFSDLAARSKTRKIFAKSLVDLLEKYQIDGIDVDWEFPVVGFLSGIKSREADKNNLNLLMAEIKKEIDALSLKNNKKYTLSLAVGVGPWINRSFDFATLQNYVDYFGVMAYNIVTSSYSNTGHHAALYPSKNYWSTKEGIDLILDNGVSPSKIIVGLPFYGRIRKGVERSDTGLYQKSHGHLSNPDVTYSNIKENYLGDKSFKKYFDNTAKADYLYSKGKNTFITYMDIKGIKYLTDYVKNSGFRGIMIWEITQDDKDKNLLNAVDKYLR